MQEHVCGLTEQLVLYVPALFIVIIPTVFALDVEPLLHVLHAVMLQLVAYVPDVQI